MALNPEDIEAHIFKVARRGYDKVEVDRFLGQVATDYRQLQQLAAAAGPAATPSPSATPAPLPRREPPTVGSRPATSATGSGQLFALDQPAEPGDDDYNRLGSEVADVLRTAHQSVATLRHEAEVDAALIRKQAERDVEELRREADDYAARVRVEADAYAAERANEAHLSRRQADQALAEAKAKADAQVADTERRIVAITEQAEIAARSRAQEILAEADRRLEDANRQIEQARSTEDALRTRLTSVHGDLSAALGRLAGDRTPEDAEAEPEAEAEGEVEVDATVTAGAEPAGAAVPADALAVERDATLDLTNQAATGAVIDLTDADAIDSGEPTVPPGWPGPAPAPSRVDDLFGDRGGAVATADPLLDSHVPGPDDAAATASQSAPSDDGPAAETAPEAADASASTGEQSPAGENDPLTDIVRDAIGRAVQSAMQHDDDDDA